MRSTKALAVAGLATLCGAGCATVVKSQQNDLVLLQSPPDIKAYAGGSELSLRLVKNERDGTARYTTKVSPRTTDITVQTQGLQLPVSLRHHVGAGWVVADLLLTGAVGIVVDAVTKRWDEFDDVNVSTAIAAARSSGTILAASGAPPISQPELPSVPPPAAASLAPPVNDRSEPAPRSTAREPVVKSGKLAVLDFKSYASDFKPEDVRYFTDLVRGATLRASPRLEVMTRENLLVMLQATGKDLGQCEGECEVDTGRRIGADAVVSGEVLKVGSRYKMSLKLHDTRSGRLLSTAIASGKTIDELDESVQKAADDLFHPNR